MAALGPQLQVTFTPDSTQDTARYSPGSTGYHVPAESRGAAGPAYSCRRRNEFPRHGVLSSKHWTAQCVAETTRYRRGGLTRTPCSTGPQPPLLVRGSQAPSAMASAIGAGGAWQWR